MTAVVQVSLRTVLLGTCFILVCVCVCVAALIGMLYAEEKERLDFVYTIYHWWQAIAIFIVYLWSHLPMRVCDCVWARECGGSKGPVAI